MRQRLEDQVCHVTSQLEEREDQLRTQGDQQSHLIQVSVSGYIHGAIKTTSEIPLVDVEYYFDKNFRSLNSGSE